ncbi:PREDICTED: uncharacterized protein LOC108972509 [Bactrocera latifrons]|uniref:Uncharacterized protein n=1 Tax=Bactrocera latifrons TaxID=174628 RepID=A0A0K8TYB9_BACLA|nr:PREDICTED: uncharacterized protein LOC108972509 [Bactrocera latifrons]
MSFLKRLAKCVIATVRTKNIANDITNTFFDIVRGESNKVQAKESKCPPQREPYRKRNTKAIYYRSHCAKQYPICGVKMLSLKSCRPQRTWSLDVEKCCTGLCKWAHPRFDDLYYMPGDNLNKKYQRTWAECTKFRVVPKAICCHQQTKYKPPKRRKPRRAIPLCDDIKTCRLTLLCRNHLSKRCPKLIWPGCKPAREPPDCHLKRVDCGPRKCTPYPSFSECFKDKVTAMKPVECNCHRIEPRCWIY